MLSRDLGTVTVHILLTNDDGIHAPGLAALERELRQLGDVCVVAPAAEQSGVGHSITFLSPLICREVYEGDRRRGWAVEGSPADCVKIGVFEFCPQRPDLIVSGINGGLNAGINVLYSGTVAAAIEGASSASPAWPCRWNSTSTPTSTEAARIARRRDRTDPAPLKAAEAAVVQSEHPHGGHGRGRRSADRADGRRTLRRALPQTPGPAGPDLLLGHQRSAAAARRSRNRLDGPGKGFVTLTPLQYDMTQYPTLRDGWVAIETGLSKPKERIMRVQGSGLVSEYRIAFSKGVPSADTMHGLGECTNDTYGLYLRIVDAGFDEYSSDQGNKITPPITDRVMFRPARLRMMDAMLFG